MMQNMPSSYIYIFKKIKQIINKQLIVKATKFKIYKNHTKKKDNFNKQNSLAYFLLLPAISQTNQITLVITSKRYKTQLIWIDSNMQIIKQLKTKQFKWSKEMSTARLLETSRKSALKICGSYWPDPCSLNPL